MHPPRSRTLVLCLLSALSAMPAMAAGKRGALPPLPAIQPASSGEPQDTRRLLEQHVLEQPRDVHARLALAQFLASQPATRRTGIVQLSQLAGSRSVGAEAIGSWRNALGGVGSEPADVALYQAYLRVRPKDTAVRMRLAEVERGLPAESVAMAAPVSSTVSPASTAAPVAMAMAASPTMLAAPAPQPLTGTAYMPPAVLPQTGGSPPAADIATTPAPVQPPLAPLPIPDTVARDAAPRPAVVPVVVPDAPRPIVAATGTAASAADYPAADARRPRADESPGQTQLRGLQTEIADIEAQRPAPEFTAGVVVRSRKGESGTSRLTDTELPMQLRMDMGDGTLTAQVTPVSLRTGGIDTSFGSIARFGGGPVVAAAQPGVSAGTQNASGVGVGVGYEQGNLAVDVGTTPIGFRYTDVNGGVRYRMPVSNDLTLTMSLSRRAVTDSVLSFAGARDSRTGQEWGGVSANGGRVDASYDRGDYGIYGYAGLARLVGHNVQSNNRAEGGAGVYWRLIKQTDTSLTAGLSLSALAFDKNLGYYTFGQGGYFSPQRFVSLGIPVDWQQRDGKLSYQIKGSLGVQRLSQDASPYFPTDATQQAANGNPVTGSTSKTGLGYGLAAALEYQVEPQWFLGGRLGIDNSRDYRQYAGSVYVRYAFRPHEGPQIMPVNPVRSPYGS
jgi:hypothetical protein